MWRRKLIELFPDDSSYWESCEYVSIAFGLLNSNLERYVAQGDADSTKRVFDFAEWAYSEKALNNSVCTGFYEGLPRNEKLHGVIAEHLPRSIYVNVRPLMEHMCGESSVQNLDHAFGLDR